MSSLCNACANSLTETRKNWHTCRILNGSKPLGLCDSCQACAAKCLNHTEVWTLSAITVAGRFSLHRTWTWHRLSKDVRWRVHREFFFVPQQCTPPEVLRAVRRVLSTLGTAEGRNLTWLKRNLGKKGGQARPHETGIQLLHNLGYFCFDTTGDTSALILDKARRCPVRWWKAVDQITG